MSAPSPAPPAYSTNRSTENFLINPSGYVDQVGGVHSSLGNGAYGPDGWYALRQTVDAVTINGGNSLSGFGDAPNVGALLLSNTSATSQRIGMAQIVEYASSLSIRDNLVSYSTNIITEATGLSVRAAILAWNGSNNAPTKNFVNNWTSTNYTVGNFFLSSGSGYEVVGVSTSLALTSSVTNHLMVSGRSPSAIPSNHLVFLWTEGAVAQSKAIYTWGHELALGGEAQVTIPRTYVDELLRCQRFVQATKGGETFKTTNLNPTGATSTSALVQMGLGTTCTITPSYGNRVFVQFTGAISNDNASKGGVVLASYGTGTAPGNNSAATGTQIGGQQRFIGGAAAQLFPFNAGGLLTGLTPGTAYWLDLQVMVLTGGTVAVSVVGCTAYEL